MENTVKIEVKGMSCQLGCANGIDAILRETNGIVKSETSFDNSSSEVTFDDTKINLGEIIEIIEKTGFQAKTAA
ncbi:MAG: heavy metal-associated domain-containing protein [Bacteroidetes bacterium]|nr:heavy metal-associated domain-containing protein [Bacteroidota bacterium]